MLLQGKPVPHLVTRSKVFSVMVKEIHGTKKDMIGKNWGFPYTGRWKTEFFPFTTGVSEVGLSRSSLAHKTCSMGRERIKGGGAMKNLWFLGGHLVTHGREQSLCCNRLLKGKVPNRI